MPLLGILPRDQFWKNVALITLSVALLPFDLCILTLTLLLRKLLFYCYGEQHRIAKVPVQRTVLVTGVGMTKGLTIAREFHKAGHRVVGADFETEWGLSPGRFSNALAKFYRLEKPSARHGSAQYVQGLLDIINLESVNIWVSCSGVASAVEDGEAKETIENRTDCLAVQFDVKTTQTLHEKHTFMDKVQQLGLNAPESYTVNSRAVADKVLRHTPAGRQYIMKPIGMDDAARGDMTLLPKPTWDETLEHLDQIKISEESAWILQQYVRGEEFCTHSIVINGKVRAFVSCPSSELLMHYEALPQDSTLNRAMLQFTERFAGRYGGGFTGHLSFDFLIEDTTPRRPDDVVLYPIECNPRAHTAVALFQDQPAMVDAYLSLLNKEANTNALATPLKGQTKKYYWMGHDLVALLLLPLLQLLTMKITVGEFGDYAKAWLTHLTSWKDGTFDIYDPLPFMALYHIYWPVQLLSCIREDRKWSRVNVSTLKMFEFS